jgi:uncharacterized protein
MSMGATLVAHALFVGIVGLLPLFGRLRYGRLKRDLEAGRPAARVRFYRRTVLRQLGFIAAVVGFWLVSDVPRAWLGLVLPEQLATTMGATIVLGLVILASIRAFRTVGSKQLTRLLAAAGAIVPRTDLERRWFALLAVGAGVSEELLTRGFLIFYLWQYLQGLHVAWTVLASAAIFGFCHLYQGWRYVLGTGLLGVGLAWYYLSTGSLLGPMILHAALDLRILFILTPTRIQALESRPQGGAARVG